MAAPLSFPPLSVYVHFPWCVSKCPYCDFNSHALRETLPEDRYVDTLIEDLRVQAARANSQHAQRQVSSVFMGGGTPSLFSPRAIARVIDALRATLPLSADAEITLEANPATVERGRFAEYRAAGINRVSLGAQSFDPRHSRRWAASTGWRMCIAQQQNCTVVASPTSTWT